MARTRDYALLCLENPLLDISAIGDETLLAKYALKANDAILASDSHTGLYEDLLNNYSAKLIAGGGAQNTARGAQYLLPPNSVVYLGGVGNDKYAAILHDAVKAAGLRVEYRTDAKEPTGRCGVIITGHNRSLCTQLGAANCYGLDHLKSSEVWKLAENAEIFFVGGYHLTVCPEAAMALAEEAAEKGKTFILSLSAPFICSAFTDKLDATAPYWDYVVGNETEALAYAEAHAWETRDVREIARKLAELPKKNGNRERVAIITQGTDPTIVATKAATNEYPVHAINESKIVDTTGAGDAFAAGLCAGLVHGKPIATCVDQGQWLAKLCIQENGPVYPFPKQTYMPSHV